MTSVPSRTTYQSINSLIILPISCPTLFHDHPRSYPIATTSITSVNKYHLKRRVSVNSRLKLLVTTLFIMNSHQDRRHCSPDHSRFVHPQQPDHTSPSSQPESPLNSYPWSHLLPHRVNESNHDMIMSQDIHYTSHANNDNTRHYPSEDAPDSPLTNTFTTYTAYGSSHSTPDDTHSRSRGPPSSRSSTPSPDPFPEEQFHHNSQWSSLRNTNRRPRSSSCKTRTLHRKRCSYDLHDDFLSHALPANFQIMTRGRSASMQTFPSGARHSGHSSRCLASL
ncbi:hypothetical protein BJ165DRAFT_385021 [Panaeolus papilionaceus]|nr:hypothetical protein BJ165DRAFT_385021 [Panaeolus papilionaceus]